MVQLLDSGGNLIPDGAGTGVVQYYAGGWRDFGTTAGGLVSKQLLPLTYSFSMSYAFARQEKGGQNVVSTPIVAFQTGQVHSDSGTAVQYYAGGWRSFAQEMQLLPAIVHVPLQRWHPNQAVPIAAGCRQLDPLAGVTSLCDPVFWLFSFCSVLQSLRLRWPARRDPNLPTTLAQLHSLRGPSRALMARLSRRNPLHRPRPARARSSP